MRYLYWQIVISEKSARPTDSLFAEPSEMKEKAKENE